MLNEYLKFLYESEDLIPNFKVGPSKIHGKGVFATKQFKSGEFINNGLLPTGKPGPLNDKTFYATDFGKFVNHSYTPNASLEFEDDAYKVYAMRDIEPGEELTSDYTQTKGLKQPKPDWK